MNASRYRKFIISLGPVLVSGLIAVQVAFGDERFTAQDGAAVTVAILTACGVWAASYPQVKSAVAFLGAGATAYAVALTDGSVSYGEWMSIVVAALAAVGVYAASNAPTPPGAN